MMSGFKDKPHFGSIFLCYVNNREPIQREGNFKNRLKLEPRSMPIILFGQLKEKLTIYIYIIYIIIYNRYKISKIIL